MNSNTVTQCCLYLTFHNSTLVGVWTCVYDMSFYEIVRANCKIFWLQYDLEEPQTIVFDLIGIRTHDFQIIESTFDVPEILA